MANAWNFHSIWLEHSNRYPTFRASTDYVATDGTNTCAYLSQGEVRKLVSTLSGLDHLEGQIVKVASDGKLSEVTEFIVSGGMISLPYPAATNHVGLPYTAKLKLLPLGGDSQQGASDTKKRKVYNIVLRVWESLGGKFGHDEDHAYPIAITTDIPYTGDIHDTPFLSSWDDIWQPVLIQDEPLPFMLLAMVIRSEISEDK